MSRIFGEKKNKSSGNNGNKPYFEAIDLKNETGIYSEEQCA